MLKKKKKSEASKSLITYLSIANIFLNKFKSRINNKKKCHRIGHMDVGDFGSVRKQCLIPLLKYSSSLTPPASIYMRDMELFQNRDECDPRYTDNKN